MEDEDSVKNESVVIMVRAKSYLDGIPEKLQDDEYKSIVAAVNEYLKKNCDHKIVMDSIDIGPEQSKTIFYCECCYQTFDSYT